jgi:hypothetical protein
LSWIFPMSVATTPPTNVSGISQFSSALKTDLNALSNLPQSAQTNAVANGVQRLDDCVQVGTANGVFGVLTDDLPTISSANLLLADTAQFIDSPTQLNAETFGKQLGAVVGTIAGKILAAPAAELALATGTPTLATLSEGAAADLGAVVGLAGATLAINVENAAFDVADGVVRGLGTYQAARATGESPLQAPWIDTPTDTNQFSSLIQTALLQGCSDSPSCNHAIIKTGKAPKRGSN